jgi:hypothetical protein
MDRRTLIAKNLRIPLGVERSLANMDKPSRFFKRLQVLGVDFGAFQGAIDTLLDGA